MIMTTKQNYVNHWKKVEAIAQVFKFESLFPSIFCNIIWLDDFYILNR